MLITPVYLMYNSSCARGVIQSPPKESIHPEVRGTGRKVGDALQSLLSWYFSPGPPLF